MMRQALLLALVAPKAMAQESCASDVTADGTVGVDDMLAMLASYGTTGCSTDTPGCPAGSSEGTAASIYVSSFNEFCSGALPDGVTALREQSKCWICEDVIRAYLNSMAAGSPWLPPAGTNFSPDSSVQHILGYDFFIFGYDSDGNYQGTPGWNDAGLGGWPPAYVGDCNAGYNEDMSACQAAIGGTYTVPTQSCMDMCGQPMCDDDATTCRQHYTTHDQEVASGGTTFYSEKVEHQYELTAMATNGAFFHGYFLDAFGLLGETVYTQPDGNGGFMSCAFNDYPWEKDGSALTFAAEAQATAAASIYVSSFNEFCSGALPDGVTALREQSKCWICEDVIRAYLNSMTAGSPWLPPAGTNFSPDSGIQHILGYDFFVFGYDSDGNYQGTPGWNDAGLGGWPPAYVGDCNAGYNEDFTDCIASVGGTYTVPEQSCMDLCSAATCDDPCREHYTRHDQEVTGGGTTFYSEKVEHQYELTAKATAGAFFHGYFLDSYGLVGETVYTQPDGAGGFMSCAFNDYAWEGSNNAASLAAEAQATAAASIYVSSFNEFCSGVLPDGVTALREQSKCWICEDIIRAYLNSMTAGSPWLPPAGTNFSPMADVTHTLGYDFFVFGYDSDGNYQGTPAWNDAGLGGWPPAYTGDCNAGYNEDFTDCIASVGGTYTVPEQSCMDLCSAATCDDPCREHYTVHDEEVTGGGTTFYSEKVEHQYELTAKATAGAFFHGYFLDSIGLLGETVYTQPDGAGGFMSCSFTDYSWEVAVDMPSKLDAMQASLDTLVAAGR